MFSVLYVISRNNSREGGDFHLKEWSYTEMTHLVKRLGYSRRDSY